MKRTLFITILLFASSFAFCQASKPMKLTASKGTSNIKKDVALEISSVYYDAQYEAPKSLTSIAKEVSPTYIIKGTQGGKEISEAASSLPKDISFSPAEDNLQSFWYAKNLESLPTISEIKNLYVTRADMESEANEFINQLEKFDLIYDDPYLESYLYSIVTKILPENRPDGFPYDLKIVLFRNEALNASIFPNGIMLVNTGLLSELHTEDELVAVLSHEIGHFVANHALVNMRKMEKKRARAEFWAGLATVAAAAVESAAAATSDYYYYPGALTASAAVLSYSIAEGFLERIGENYSREQEEEADKMAMNVLKYLGYDKNGLASLFQRMTDVYNAEGNWAAYYMSGDHPSLQKRIEYSGTPSNKRDPAFERKVSFVVTEAALFKYSRGRFAQASKLASQNIENKVGTDDDYLIKALCTLNLYSDSRHNAEAQTLIQEAKRINPDNSNIIRAEIIACLRNNDNARAKSLIDTYRTRLSDQMRQENTASKYYSFLSREQEWARKMSVKVNGL